MGAVNNNLAELHYDPSSLLQYVHHLLQRKDHPAQCMPQLLRSAGAASDGLKARDRERDRQTESEREREKDRERERETEREREGQGYRGRYGACEKGRALLVAQAQITYVIQQPC